MRVHVHRSLSPAAGAVEVVERKGLGHPDTICDAIAEHVCVRLCLAYRERFGTILHHNVDKVLLCGGAARPAFGGGEVLAPLESYLAGRAAAEHGGAKIRVHDVAIDACREWLGAHLRGLDVERHVRIESRLRPGSTDLTRLFAREGVPPANDTSCGAGFAPLTDLEATVLAVERALNHADTKRTHPEIGEDIKVMGVRQDGRIQLTIGCAFVGRHVAGLEDYARKKDAAIDLVRAAASSATALGVDVTLNAADDLDRGEIFLTVTGTSAEAGDDGEVGRGNRVSGLITPYRPMTLEAAAGKNPVTHVGKLYSLVATSIAAAVTRELAGVDDASCVLVSDIGHRVDEPRIVDVGAGPGAASVAAVTEIARSHLAGMGALREALLAERLGVC